MKTRILAIVSVLLSALSCRQAPPCSRPPVAVVQNIISGAESDLAAVLSSYDRTSPNGDISVIDSPEREAMLTEALLSADAFDNIDASAVPDRLPDFAGERIVSLMDIARDSYVQMDSMTLRDIAVRSTISAMDTRLCTGPLDTEYRSSKPSSKVVIITSPEMQAAGAYDIDTLMRAASVDIPVIMPLRTILSGLISAGSLNIGVLADGLSSLSGAYDTICEEVAPAGVHSSCFVMSTDDIMGSDVLIEFLQSYKDSGNSASLDALVVDSFYYDVDDLRSQYASILLEDISENVEVRRLMSSSFDFVTVAQTATEECYKIMRQRNIFTHDIRYPQAGAYLTNPEMFQYALMQFDWNSLPSGLESDLMNAAPNTYSAYVQNQRISGGN